ncbi:hypothetical protein [Mucilaginibacter sp.]|uniref:hypothetical protein n=1 Tax=Mucilaginibacter sp. TaxID=1882438 RepID=UPI003D11261D
MLKKIPIKKAYLLAAASILFLVVSYELAFRQTIAAFQLHQELKAQLTQGADLSIQPAYLLRKDHNLNQLLARYRTDTTASRSGNLGTISQLAEKENVRLSEVPQQDPLYGTAQYSLQKLSFEGSFFALTTVLSKLQNSTGIGMIRSVNYKITLLKNSSATEKKLILELYLENTQ